MKYLGINLAEKLHEILSREIQKDLGIWRLIPCSWIGRFNIVKM